MNKLEPCYNFSGINQGLSLVKNLQCLLRINQESQAGSAEIILDVFPNPRINIIVNFTADLKKIFSLINSEIELESVDGKEISAILTERTSSTESGNVKMIFVPRKEPFQWIGNDETKIVKVIFHLFNYKETMGTSNTTKIIGNTHYLQPITELKSENWIVELENIIPDPFNELTQKGGYGLTHVGCFYRSDGVKFDGKTAGIMWSCLHNFFTFSRGFFCSPILLVGYDEKDQKVWEQFNSPRDKYWNSITWFDQHHCEQLAQLFPVFLEKCEDERWGETIGKIIYWYARSNNLTKSGLDTGIILTQIAIERLAYEYSVNVKGLIESNGFKNLKASDKFRILLASLDIPLAIPESLTGIKQAAGDYKYVDGPHAITEIRNSLVHPDHKREKELSPLYFETWKLGLWYLELAILRLCDYNGTYFNRTAQNLVIGAVENVPWSKKGVN
jgi:hypothetical protein